MGKQRSLDEKMASAENDLRFKLDKNFTVFDQNKSVNFSPVQTNMSRYLTYGSKVYGQLGFDPTRDNNALYNTKTSALDDVSRAIEGSLKLAKIGFSDTFAFGSTAGKSNSLMFEKTMNDYGSTRGGGAGLFSNTLLSSGYTAGILGAIALEEVLMTGLTAATAGATSGIQGLRTATLLGKGFDKMEDASTMLKTLQKAADAKEAKSFFGKSFLNSMNPIENTLEFGKDLMKTKSNENIFNLANVVKGSASLVRDARKISMTHSEAKLEAELAQNETFKKEYEKEAAKYENGIVPDSVVADLKNKTQHVYNKVYYGNLKLIYATNAIVFDNMFKTMKGVNKFFNHTDNGFFKKTFNKKTGSVSFEALTKPVSGVKRYMLDTAKDLTTVKGLSKSLLSASMEGFQEVGQDIISEGVKSYYTKKKDVEQIKGGFLNQIFEDLRLMGTDQDYQAELQKAGASMFSEKGLETFLSGALMGAFASPVGLATQGVNSFLFEGGLDSFRSQLKSTEGYRKAEEQKFKTRQAKAKVLTEVFNTQKNFVDFVDHPIFNQHVVQSDIMDSARANDDRSFKSAQERSFAEGILTILETGMQAEFKEHLNYMAENFDLDQLKEAFGREDITPENENDFRQKLRDRSTKVDEYKKRFDHINSNFTNPIKLDTLQKEDPNFLDKYVKHKAYEDLKKELVFSTGAIADRVSRMNEIEKDLTSFSKADAGSMSRPYSVDAIGKELELLDTLLKANAELELSPDAKLDNDLKKEHFDKLSKYKTSLSEYINAVKSKKNLERSKRHLKEDFLNLNSIDLEKVKDGSVDQVSKTFDKILDYVILNEEKGNYESFIDALSSFEQRDRYAEMKKEFYKEFDSNKEYHINSALKAFEEKQVSDEMLNELYSNGLFFNLTELDDLLSSGEMPEEIYDVVSGKLADKEQRIKAQTILKQYVSKLKNLELLEKDSMTSDKIGRRYVSDNRIVQDLINQFPQIETPFNLSSIEGELFIESLFNSPYLTGVDELLLSKFIPSLSDYTLNFVTDLDAPIEITDTEITIDLRYASSEYVASKNISFESLLTRAFTQVYVSKLTSSNLTIVNQAMLEIKELLKSKLVVSELPFLNDPISFINEALNNSGFQKLLSDITLSTTFDSQLGTWEELHSELTSLLKLEFEGKALSKVLNIIDQVFEGSLTEESSDLNEVETAIENPEFEPEQTSPDKTTSLQQKQSSLYAELIEVNKSLSSPNLKRREKKRLQQKQISIGVELNKIQDQLDLVNENPALVSEVKFSKSELPTFDYTPMYDSFDNLMVQSSTSWKDLPIELKTLFAKIHSQKSVELLTREDVIEIISEMQENPIFLEHISEYNQKITAASEKEFNANAISKNRLAVKERVEKEKSRKRNKPRKEFTSLENIQRMIPDVDLSILSEKEATQLLKQFTETKNTLTPFSVSDIISYVNDKKNKQSLRSEKKNLARQQIARKNSESLPIGKVRIPQQVGNTTRYVKVVINDSVISYLQYRYPNSFFIKSSEDFKKDIYDKLLDYYNESENLKQYLKGVTDLENPVNIFTDLLISKRLTPKAAELLNKKYAELNIPYAVKKTTSKEYGFKLVYVKRKASTIKRAPLTPVQRNLEVIYDYLNMSPSFSSDLTKRALIAFAFSNKKLSPGLVSLIGNGNYAASSRKAFVSDSGIDSRDAFAETATADFTVDDFSNTGFVYPDQVAELQDYLDDLLIEYSTPSKLIKGVSDEIRLMFDSVSNDNFEVTGPQSYDLLDYFSTEEGQQDLTDQLNLQSSYYNTLEFQIETGQYKGLYSELTDSQKALYDLAASNGVYNEAYSLDYLLNELNNTKRKLVDLRRSEAYINGNQESINNEFELLADISNYETLIESLTETEILDSPISPDSFIIEKTEMDLEIERISKQLPINYDSFKLVEVLTNVLDKQNPSLFTAIAVLKLTYNSYNISESQEKLLVNKVLQKINLPFNKQQPLLIKNEIHILQSINKTEVVLKKLDGELVKLTLPYFANSFVKTLTSGETLDNSGVDPIVSLGEIAYIKTSFLDILNNFDTIQFESNESTLIDKINEHLKTCN